MIFSRDLFFKDFWKTELVISLILALVIGYEIQMFADSGGAIYDKLFLSVATAVVSYLLAFIGARFFLSRLIPLPSWVWIGVVGSAVFGFARSIIIYSIENRRYRGGELTISSEQFAAFLLLTLISSYLLLGMIFIFRLVTLFFLYFNLQKN